MFRTAPANERPPVLPDAPLLRLRDVEKWYPAGSGRSWVLRQINLDIHEGEFVTVMGPSGAGKSTLLGILGLYDGDWQGAFHLLGQPIAGLKPKQRVDLNRRHVGFVFQKYHLLDDLTVYENLDVPLSYRDVPRRERQAIVAEALDRFGIVAKKDLYPSQLSGGQQQLVGVARAVIARPKLLLADEPTGNLHSAQAREIMGLFRRLNEEGTTIVQVTHSVENAAYGSRVLELQDGWLTEDRPVAR